MWNQILPICALALCALFVGVTGSPQKDRNQRIVSGTLASLRDAPYIAVIFKRYSNGFLCGGSVITSHHILSAAHCFTDNYEFSARMGSEYFYKGGVVIDIKTIMNHPEYNQNTTYDSDIAVLELKEHIPLNDELGIQIVNLPSLHIENVESMMVFGWGATEVSKYSNRLRKVKVPVINWNVCRESFPFLTSNMFCAGDLDCGGDSGKGDSGGPIVENDTIYGIVSFGINCDVHYHPGVYTDVTKFLPWIRSHIEI